MSRKLTEESRESIRHAIESYIKNARTNGLDDAGTSVVLTEYVATLLEMSHCQESDATRKELFGE